MRRTHSQQFGKYDISHINRTWICSKTRVFSPFKTRRMCAAFVQIRRRSVGVCLLFRTFASRYQIINHNFTQLRRELCSAPVPNSCHASFIEWNKWNKRIIASRDYFKCKWVLLRCRTTSLQQSENKCKLHYIYNFLSLTYFRGISSTISFMRRKKNDFFSFVLGEQRQNIMDRSG